MMWHGSHIATLNYDNDFMGLIRDGMIQIHASDVEKLESEAVLLHDGSRLETDALFYATGWKCVTSIKFLGVSDDDLALPRTTKIGDKSGADVDEQIFRAFPILRNAPQVKAEPMGGITVPPQEPYRLFRFAAPPRLVPMRTIAFAGHLASVTGCLTAQTQALWIAAFLHGKLGCIQRPVGELESEAFLHAQFCKRRSPMGFGHRHADFSSDSLPFLDLILRDLGLRTQRKRNAFWECFEPYGKDDYRGLISEWLGKTRVID